MTIGGSIALIVAGAILRFAVTWHGKYVDLQAIGEAVTATPARPGQGVAQPCRSPEERNAATRRATSVARKIWPVSASRTATA